MAAYHCVYVKIVCRLTAERPGVALIALIAEQTTVLSASVTRQ